MSVWPGDGGAAIDGYVAALHLRHPRARAIYRSELLRFQRFIEARGTFDEAAVATWLRDRATAWPHALLVDRANKVNRFLDDLVVRGILPEQPLAVLKSGHRQRALAPIVAALVAADPDAALASLSGTVRFGSFLGPRLREYIELRQALGYRFTTQAAAFASFDRFLQGRPDLEGQPVDALIRVWSANARTLEQRWAGEALTRDLMRAWSRVEPGTPQYTPDPRLRRQVLAARRRPFLFTPEQVATLLDTARRLPSPRAPLRPPTAHAMLTLAYCAGLRLGELVRLDIGDLDLVAGTITIRNSKFYKSRRLPLDPSVMVVLRQYLAERAAVGAPATRAAPLFWRQMRLGGGRYSAVATSGMLITVLRRAGLKPATGRRGPRVHDVRHSFVHHRMLAWYRDGVDPQSQLSHLATFLGHRDANSTRYYVTATPELLGLAAERWRVQLRGLASGAEGSP